MRKSEIETKLRKWSEAVINNKDYQQSTRRAEYGRLLEKYYDIPGHDPNIAYWASEALQTADELETEARMLVAQARCEFCE